MVVISPKPSARHRSIQFRGKEGWAQPLDFAYHGMHITGAPRWVPGGARQWQRETAGGIRVQPGLGVEYRVYHVPYTLKTRALSGSSRSRPRPGCAPRVHKLHMCSISPPPQAPCEGAGMRADRAPRQAPSRLPGCVTGHVDHFCSGREDLGWGCGWRNIQMGASHLLRRRQVHTPADGSGVELGALTRVPDSERAEAAAGT